MTFRTSVLVACIVVVPLIAMFSHRVPSGARAALAAFLRDVVQPRPVPVAADAAPLMPSAPAAVETVATVQVETVGAVQVEAVGAAEPTRVVRAAASVAADGIARLRELGAVAIDCRPLHGRAGHVASCRMPVDGAGELERVFQATGADAASATDNLERDVTAWRRRPPAGTPGTMRF